MMKTEMSQDSLVSIIVPAYQAEHHIGECLECLMKQSYHNLEILTINDGSTDRTQDICEFYANKDSRIRCIKTNNNGVSAARNMGLLNASGNFIMFVDSDDKVHNEYVEKMVETLVRSESDLCVCTYRYMIDGKERGIIAGNYYGDYMIKDRMDVIADLFISKLLNPIWNKLYRKENITFLYDTNFLAGEDLLFNLYYIKNVRKISIIQYDLYIYNMYRSNGIRTLYKRIEFNSFIKVYEEVLSFFKDNVCAQLYLRIEDKFINELSGCFLTSLINNNLNPVETVKEYKYKFNNKEICMAVKSLTEGDVNNLWARMIINKKYILILILQYLKYCRNKYILCKNRYSEKDN